MIVDLRTYTVPVGLLREFLSLYACEGLPVQARHLGEPIGWYTTEAGELGEVVHLWGYDDMADRERRRAALEADPAWLAYRGKASARGHVVRQVNSLLRKVDFDALQRAGLSHPSQQESS
ncbi:MAG: family containing protein [Ramlibacter sp.]|nr:family containing protein [Ramlibacter sp.]MDB5911666.1 family containing protein [Ramlibacter sp.]